MSKRRITIYFTSDDEAGAVYGMLRALKRNGFFQSFNISEQDAEISLDPEDVEIVLAYITDLRSGRTRKISYPGISFTEK